MKIKNGFEFGFMFACGVTTYLAILGFAIVVNFILRNL